MILASPLALLLLPLALALAIPRWRWSLRPRLAVASIDAARAAARPGWRLRLRWLPGLLRVLAIAALVLALARPQQGLAFATVPEEGIDVVVALDASSSMDQPTPDGVSRLNAARAVVQEFIGGLDGDRVGLVIFQSRALALSPLTLDRAAVSGTVRQLRGGLLPDGTAIGLGVAQAVDLLRDSPARSRAIVLLTDGANNAGEVSPVQAASIAASLGIRVYTIGFLDAATGRRGSTIDEATLRGIASTTGGTYYDAATREELATAYRSIGELERSRIGERHYTAAREFAPWLAGAAVALLLAELALRSTALRRHP